MIVIKVQYTTDSDFVKTNKGNIKIVMNDLRKLDNKEIRYSAFIEEDGCSFMHFAMYPDEETLNIVTNLPSFINFQTELKSSGLVSPPKVEHYTLVDSSYITEV